MSDREKIAVELIEKIHREYGVYLTFGDVSQIVRDCLRAFDDEQLLHENREITRLRGELEATQDALRREIRRGMGCKVTA